ncbi:MAG: cupin domain-containing protein [Pseudomonadales bacterium]|nr:cupin domain-containing protein [Pseudomonadales bacterium]
MKINMDFTKPVIVQTNNEPWVDSPLPGVKRRMLERDGGEFITRATSIVNYDKNSFFSEHTHTGGEEFIVLDGIFSDESGQAPKGMCVRNPPGSSHAPFSEQGCRIFVKLEQFNPEDTEFVRIDTSKTDWLSHSETGVKEMLLYAGKRETVKLVAIPDGGAVNHETFPGGCEILVMKGTVVIDQQSYGQHTWIRRPPNSEFSIAGQDSAQIYVKYGYLLD